MNSQLEPVKDVLRNFLSQMKKKEEIWKALGKNIAGTHGFGDDEVNPWLRKEACCWAFADLYDHFGRFRCPGCSTRISYAPLQRMVGKKS